MMQLPLLCDKIARFLARRLNSEKFFKFHRIAEKFNCSSLKDSCFEFATENLGAISSEYQFQDLEKEYMISLMKCQSSPYSEDAKCSVRLKWIKCDVNDRKSFLSPIMNALELKKISQRYCKYLIENETLCFESSECLKNLFIAVMNRVETADGTPASVLFSGRKNAVIFFDKASKALQVYHPSNNTRMKMHDLHEDLPNSLGYTAVVNEKVLYVLMATRKFLKLNIMEAESTWEPLPNMLLEHGEQLRAAVLDNFIYVAGANSMERYSITAEEWEAVDSDNVYLNHCALLAYDKCIYVLGGYEAQPLSDVKIFFPVTSTLSEFHSLYNSVGNMASVVHEERIVWAGGRGYVMGSECRLFNKEFGRWENLSSMCKTRLNFVICNVNGVLFAIGGDTPSTIEMYNFETKRWKELVTLTGMDIMAQATVALWLPKY